MLFGGLSVAWYPHNVPYYGRITTNCQHYVLLLLLPLLLPAA